MTEWMRSGDVAELAGAPVYRVYRAVDTGALPAYRIGRHYRCGRDEVDAWIERREQVGTDDDDRGRGPGAGAATGQQPQPLTPALVVPLKPTASTKG